MYVHLRYTDNSPKPTRAAPIDNNSSSPPNNVGSYQDPEETPIQIPRAREVIKDLYMSDTNGESITGSVPESQMDLPDQVMTLTNAVHTMVKVIK